MDLLYSIIFSNAANRKKVSGLNRVPTMPQQMVHKVSKESFFVVVYCCGCCTLQIGRQAAPVSPTLPFACFAPPAPTITLPLIYLCSYTGHVPAPAPDPNTGPTPVPATTIHPLTSSSLYQNPAFALPKELFCSNSSTEPRMLWGAGWGVSHWGQCSQDEVVHTL